MYIESSLPFFMKTYGWWTNTSSCNSRYRKTNFTSKWCNSHPFETAIGRRIRTVSIRAIDENTSSKSMLGCCRYPFAMSLALYFLIEPFVSLLTFNNHFRPTIVVLLGFEINFQVPFFSIDEISSYMALTLFELSRASL